VDAHDHEPACPFEDYSIEVTARGAGALLDMGGRLLQPDGVFIPYLPEESDADRATAAAAVQAAGYRPVPHIAARRVTSRDALDRFLARVVKDAGIDTLFLIAGDPATPFGPFEDTLSILRSGLIEKHGIRRIGIGGHPEGHPQVAPAILREALADKAAAAHELGIECEIVTQFAFDPAPVLDWLRELRGDGIDVPVRIGIAGPASVRTLMRYAMLCGVGASGKAMAKYGLSLTRLLSKSGPDRFMADFLAAPDLDRLGPIRFHLFPFGGLADAADWLSAFRGANDRSCRVPA
jgi:methylenetetrahydrofolate reductase (NADPH)